MSVHRLTFPAGESEIRASDPLTVGIDSHGNFVRHNVQETARKRLEIIDVSL
jgi:hypothetical protein